MPKKKNKQTKEFYYTKSRAPNKNTNAKSKYKHDHITNTRYMMNSKTTPDKNNKA